MKWLLVNPRPGAFRVMGGYEKVMAPFAPMGLAYLAESPENNNLLKPARRILEKIARRMFA